LNHLSKIIDKLYLKQWSIGIADISIEDVIRNKKIEKDFTWVAINNNYQFFADPFIFKSKADGYSFLYEDFDYNNQYGKISMGTLDNNNRVISTKVQIDTKSHLSYPSIFIEDGTMYVFPEAAASEKLSCYQYDYNTNSINYKTDIINLPLVDSTILKYKDKYWIFGTMKGDDSNKKLYIYYSKNLFGPYIPHTQNPVKNNINGSRPAGNFIEIDGNLYRPAQGSEKYYGSCIIIYKVIDLSENNFEEEYYMSITPSKKNYYNFGIHTINYVDNKIIVDGLTRRLLPFIQLTTFFQKKNKRHFKIIINHKT
jgi:hypothetical protein